MVPHVRFLGLALVIALPGSLALADATSLARYAGDFEIYTGDNYTQISISARDSGLVSSEAGKDEYIRLSPVADSADVFSSPRSESGEVCVYRFLRDETGVFRTCLIQCGQRRLEGSRVDPGAAWRCDPEHLFLADQLRQDLRQIWHFIESEHPAPYALTGKGEFARLRAELDGALTRPLRVTEFFPIAARMVSRLGCGHTRLLVPRGFWSAEPDRYFPLDLQVLIDGVFMAGSFDSAHSIPIGSQILSINGEGASEIVASVSDLVTTDGFNLTGRRARVRQYFPFYYTMTRGFPSVYEVCYRAPGDVRVTTASVGSIRRTRLDAGLSQQAEADLLALELLPGRRVARITIRSFGYYDQPDHFKAFVDSSMACIRDAGVGSLILDLRGNQGGDPWCTSHLLSYLIRQPVPYFAKEYGPYAPLARPVPQAEHPYAGRLYVLIDGACFSSTGHFCSLLKYHRIGTFVGEETGGGYVCNDGSKLVELRCSRMRMSVPRERFYAAVKGFVPGHGIQPDHRVAPTGADLAAGRDVVLDLAVKLASKEP